MTTLSYSGLADYARCGYRFYLERSLRLPATPAPEEPPAEAEGLPGTQRGTLAHRLLEDLDFARPQAPSAEAVRAVADELGIPVTDDDLTDLAGLVGSFAAAPLCARLAAATAVRREAPFAYPLQAPEGEVLVHGFIDVIARDGDRALVVDYKSDRLEPEGGDPAERVERDYRTQRLVYALAALRDGAARGRGDVLLPRARGGAGQRDVRGLTGADAGGRADRPGRRDPGRRLPGQRDPAPLAVRDVSRTPGPVLMGAGDDASRPSRTELSDPKDRTAAAPARRPSAPPVAPVSS